MKKPFSVLYHALVIAWKDLIEFKRSRIGLIFSILFPVMIIAMFGYMFPSSANMVHDVQVGLVSEDSGMYSGNVTSMLRSFYSNSTAFNLVDVSSVDQAKAKIMSGEIKGAVVIPQNFSESIQLGKQAKVIILTDPSSPALSAAVTQAFSGTVRMISDQLAEQMIRSGMPDAGCQSGVHPATNFTCFRNGCAWWRKLL